MEAQFLWSKADERRFNETIVFFHHFDGSAQLMLPYMKWVNRLGFDAISFDLAQIPEFSDSQFLKLNLRAHWVQIAKNYLKKIEGPKILYSFSFPSAIALQSATGSSLSDIKGWICDGGPFLDLQTCFWNYFKIIKKVPLALCPSLTLLAFFRLGGHNLKNDIQTSLQLLPFNFPILSILAWQDKLVAKSSIEKCFQGIELKGLQKLQLPEADHLEGFYKYKEEYRPRVQIFLEQISTKLT